MIRSPAVCLAACGRDERGLAYVEFALSVGILLLLFLGSIEVSRLVLIIQKVEKTAATVADVVTQADPNTSPLTTTVLSQLMSAVVDMLAPYPAGNKVLVIITDVTKTGSNAPVVNWQYCGGGTLSAVSKIGVRGANAVLPQSFVMNPGEEIVFSEVYYAFTPLTVQSAVTASTLYRYAAYMPRLGALTSFSSSCP